MLADREKLAAKASFLLLGKQPNSLTLDGTGGWEAASRLVWGVGRVGAL